MKNTENINRFKEIIFGYSSKDKEDEYKYFYYSNIFKNTKNVILLAASTYFLLGIFDSVFNDISISLVIVIKLLVSIYGFVLGFTNVLSIKRKSSHVLLFYSFAAF